ncbi:MAG: Rid family detoxifying hydrolase [Planctomycetes bacterium]|nr:Rid family detoxifying hydrolase [Planctomycetota bacterium]
MDPQVVSTPHAPAAIGPYSQAVVAGDLVFCSGQIALRPDGALEQGGVEAETRQVLTNLRAVLEAAGSSLGRVVKTTVFLRDMADFQAMNGVYAEFFPGAAPARATVAVAGLPRGVRVEVEAVAVRGALTG